MTKPPSAYLWYFGVAAEQRDRGIGTTFYQEIVKWIKAEVPDAQALILDVERPESAKNDSEAQEHCRRIRFYCRASEGRLLMARDTLLLTSVEDKSLAYPAYACLDRLAPEGSVTFLL